MARHITISIRLIVTLWSAVAFAQIATTQTDATIQNSTVAYVYVSNNNQNTKAFAAASDGKLTPVSGSPFRTGYVASMAVNAKYLFLTDTVYIYSFSIASDGAIRKVASINAQKHNPGSYGGPGILFLDRTGATLYDTDFYCCGDSDAYQFFNINNSTGKPSYLGVTQATWDYWEPLSFSGNNMYAY